MTAPWRILTLLLAAAPLYLGGCIMIDFPTESLKFRLVDANTHQPISGTAGTFHSSGRTILTIVLFKGKNGDFPLAPSDAQGVVVAKGLHPSQEHVFHFEKPGYLSTGGEYFEGGDGF